MDGGMNGQRRWWPRSERMNGGEAAEEEAEEAEGPPWLGAPERQAAPLPAPPTLAPGGAPPPAPHVQRGQELRQGV